MNTTIFNHEISQQIQQERIDVLNETIDVMDRIIKSDEEQINILKHTIEINKQNIFNTLVKQMKGERDFNPKMNMTDAQINDLAQDVKDSSNNE